MIQTSRGTRPSAFSSWLRTGARPPVRPSYGIELKFNPWHDPEDGRFTFAGAGSRAGAGVAEPRGRVDTRPPKAGQRRMAAMRNARTAPAGPPAAAPVRGTNPARPTLPPKPDAQRNAAAEFAGGVGEGLYDVGADVVSGVGSLLTTNPLTTGRNLGYGIARSIDKALTAENTPARTHIARAADAVAHASPRELGHGVGTAAGNVAMAVIPGAAVSRVARLSRAARAAPSATYKPFEMGWVKETLKSDKDWKIYNDAAPGSRPGQAPTLMRTLPDGSKRPVKFDGVIDNYMIDRKWSVSSQPRAVAQALRQSAVLKEHGLFGTWEVPNELQRAKARKLFKKLNITNIKVRVVKP